jgi:hypothetical protein
MTMGKQTIHRDLNNENIESRFFGFKGQASVANGTIVDDWLASARIMGKNLWLIPQFAGIIRCGVPGCP